MRAPKAAGSARPLKLPKLVMEATLCSDAYSKIDLKTSKAVEKRRTTEFIAKPDTGAGRCLIGRAVIRRMGQRRTRGR